LFHIIKSMNMPTYVGLMLTLIVISIYYIIKYRRVKVPWKILMYFLVVNSIVLMINRIIEEYQSNTHLEKISSNVALISSGIFIASIFVVGIITKVKEKR
jgi:predicted membrane channel-forming protein YqfA (hemolysin III family)